MVDKEKIWSKALSEAVDSIDSTQIVSTDGDTLIKASDSYIKTALNSKNIGYATGTYYKLRSPDMTTQFNLTDDKSPSVSTDSGATWKTIATTEDVTEVSDRVDAIEEVKCKLVSGTVSTIFSFATISTGIESANVVAYSLLLQTTDSDTQWWDGSSSEDEQSFNHFYNNANVVIADPGTSFTANSIVYRVLVWYTE